MRKITYLLLSCAALVSFSHAAVVVSDGPTDSATQGSGSGSGNSKVVTTDGPREWTQASQNGVHLYGQWVVESEGPGTAKVVGAPADPAASPFPSPLVKGASSSEPASADAAPAASTNKIVVSDGPGTETTTALPAGQAGAPAVKAKHAVKVAHAKKTSPVAETETSTLAPMIPTKTQGMAMPPAVQAPLPAIPSPVPQKGSVAAWKMATFLLSFALIVLLSVIWTTRKRTF